MLTLSIYMARYIRWGTGYDLGTWVVAHAPEAVTYVAIFWLTMLALGMYQREIVFSLSLSLVRLMVSFTLGFVLLSMAIYVLHNLAIWRSIIAIAMPMAFFAIMLLRAAFRRFTGVDAFKRKVLVLGTGKMANRVAELEEQGVSPDFTCVGFVGPSQNPSTQEPCRNHNAVGPLVDYARRNDVDEIVVAREERRGGLPMEELLACKAAHIRITEFQTFWERETGQVDLDSLRPSWIIYSDGFVGGPLQALVKRIFDVTASLLLLLFSLPMLVLGALAVKLTSRGPVLYRQERVGLGGRHFMLLKFRSMYVDAESDGMPRWAGERDPRVTPVGGFIRKTRIDELPQIFNVLRGDMSFIGPRPERPFFVETLAEQIPYYSERHQVKPGISGWAQLNYPYGASVEDAKMKLKYDLYYIKNYSVFLDLIVLMQTVRVILWSEGAR